MEEIGFWAGETKLKQEKEREEFTVGQYLQTPKEHIELIGGVIIIVMHFRYGEGAGLSLWRGFLRARRKAPDDSVEKASVHRKTEGGKRRKDQRRVGGE